MSDSEAITSNLGVDVSPDNLIIATTKISALAAAIGLVMVVVSGILATEHSTKGLFLLCGLFALSVLSFPVRHIGRRFKAAVITSGCIAAVINFVLVSSIF